MRVWVSMELVPGLLACALAIPHTFAHDQPLGVHSHGREVVAHGSGAHSHDAVNDRVLGVLISKHRPQLQVFLFLHASHDVVKVTENLRLTGKVSPIARWVAVCAYVVCVRVRLWGACARARIRVCLSVCEILCRRVTGCKGEPYQGLRSDHFRSPAVNCLWGWCSRTNPYASVHMPPKPCLRSMMHTTAPDGK